MEEGVITKWHKRENEFVEAGELLLEIATDKATVEHTALDEGWLRVILIQEGEQARVNQPIALFTAQQNDPVELPPEEKKPPEQMKSQEPITQTSEPLSQATSTTPGLMQPAFVPEPPLKLSVSPTYTTSRLVASPLAKKLAKERGLDLTTVKGSGPGGRIVAKDLEKAQPEGPVAFSRQHYSQDAPGSYEEIAMTPMRKAIAKRLQESKTFIPHFYVKRKIDVGAMVALRMQLQEMQLKVSVNDLIIRACALALRQHPEINRGFNSVTQKIIQFKTIDISVAVSLEQGLITPILRQCDFKNLGNIALEVRELAKKAREGKLKEEEYKGGSFCISNLGMYGVNEFSAVINPPQAAILAVGAIKAEAVVKEGKVCSGETLCLTLSADHRVIDGAQAAQFLATLAKLIENPVSLALS
jgi:pyruvate dehydrogenase E2 component (dihydrolipoamide acetyltransferase)